MKTITHAEKVTATLHKIKARTAPTKKGYSHKVEVTRHTKISGEWQKTRKRKFFSDKDSAKAYAEEINDASGALGDSTRALILESEKIEEAQRAFKLLEPTGASLTEAVQFFLADHQKKQELITLTVSEAVERYMAGKTSGRFNKGGRRLSVRSMQTLREVVSEGGASFGRFFAGNQLYDLEESDLLEWILEPDSTTTARKRFTYSFGLMQRAKLEKWIFENPLEGTERPTATPAKEFFTSDKTRLLINSVSGDIQDYLTLGFFAGLRSSEIRELYWEDIDFGENEIFVNGTSSKETKTGEATRIAPLQENLTQWLSLTPPHERVGPIVKPNFQRRFNAARERAGFKQGWPQNVARNTFATMRFAQLRGEDRATMIAAEECGHDAKTFEKHYKKNVSRPQGREHFAIAPTSPENVTKLSAKSA